MQAGDYDKRVAGRWEDLVMAMKTSTAREAVKHGLVWFVLFFAFFPLYLMVVISFKTNEQFKLNQFLPDAPASGTSRTGCGGGTRYTCRSRTRSWCRRSA